MEPNTGGNPGDSQGAKATATQTALETFVSKGCDDFDGDYSGPRSRRQQLDSPAPDACISGIDNSDTRSVANAVDNSDSGALAVTFTVRLSVAFLITFAFAIEFPFPIAIAISFTESCLQDHRPSHECGGSRRGDGHAYWRQKRFDYH